MQFTFKRATRPIRFIDMKRLRLGQAKVRVSLTALNADVGKLQLCFQHLRGSPWSALAQRYKPCCNRLGRTRSLGCLNLGHSDAPLYIQGNSSKIGNPSFGEGSLTRLAAVKIQASTKDPCLNTITESAHLPASFTSICGRRSGGAAALLSLRPIVIDSR